MTLSMILAIIIPVNSPEDGKSRLKGALTDGDRLALNWWLFAHTLDAVDSLNDEAQIYVVSRSAAILSEAARRGFGTYCEPDDSDGLNAAVSLAAQMAAEGGATEVMVLPVDLPLLVADTVCEAIAGFGANLDVAIVTDERGSGTNLLMWRPIGSARFRYGTDSANAHGAIARAAGLRIEVRRDPILSFDLDTPEDLKRWRI
jgi:2-phospho-L-lactate guanylyltransferase